MRTLWLVVAVVLGVAPAVSAQPRETAAVVTEIKPGKGKVEVRSAGADWRPAGPLQALRGGDQLRASGDATVVVLFSGGRGTMKVDAAASPWTVPATAVDGKSQKAQALVASSIGFLASGTKEPPKAVLSTRAIGAAPEILTPRNGPVLPDTLVFEWLGSQFSRYTVRVAGANGVLVEKTGVVGARFAYPVDAPALTPGVRYRFEVEALGHPVQATTFEVVDPVRGTTVVREIRELESELGAAASAGSVTVAKAGVLAAAGLFHDARLLVLAALKNDPDEPTLHTLLGHLYMRTGLERQAAASFDEAQFLLSRDR
ncbi:MAG: hypothetical protein FJ027_05370 [Candidatus Rokubacteria bacterium]|nr:hypothetical protein [Candidatus Rokubacteria bacterium]